MNVSELNMANANQQPTFITADGCTLYFHSTRNNPNVAAFSVRFEVRDAEKK